MKNNFKHYSKQEHSEKFFDVLQEILNVHTGDTARAVINTDPRLLDNNNNWMDVQFDFTIHTWEIEKYEGHQILIINRSNLNNGTRLDLDLETAEHANVTLDQLENYQTILCDGVSLWFNYKKIKLKDCSNMKEKKEQSSSLLPYVGTVPVTDEIRFLREIENNKTTWYLPGVN